jgi:two-component system sensor histidine kinase KdpD
MDSDDGRPDPDSLLVQVTGESAAARSGRLFIFLGMCPGVGKTYAMLEAARKQLKAGVDLVIGVIETHGRADTLALLDGVPEVRRKLLEYRGSCLEEFDIDAVLLRNPSAVLVDELAHSNAPGSRHAKRYQDVLELLDAGVDVYTTLNVQHIESQVDVVQQVTGVRVRETVPDSILDRAHEIQLVDLSVEKLQERLAEGKVYLGDRAGLAAANFFKTGNLTALRELALRFTAEHVDRDLEEIRRTGRVRGPWKTNARLMVGVGPSPYAESLIRWTRRAAARQNCPWLVVWVEGTCSHTPDEIERVTQALRLARRLGAEVVTVTGGGTAEALLQVARDRNVTQIIAGKTDHPNWWRRSLADQLIQGSGDIDVCLVRPVASSVGIRQEAFREPVPTAVVGEYSLSLVIVFAIASACWCVVPITGYMFVALVFLLAIVLSAMALRRGPVIAMATLSAVCWNYFFIQPLFTFHIAKAEDWIMFVMFFLVALSMGSLTSRLRMREVAERRRLTQTDALLRVTQSAALSPDPEKGLAEAVGIIDGLLHGSTALVLGAADRSLPEVVHPASTYRPSPNEWGVVAWCYSNKRRAGRFTDTLPESVATWFPLQTATSVAGVLGVRLPLDAQMDFTALQMIEGFAVQLALVAEKEHFIQAVNRANVLAESEKLRRTLLDSVSHELKTPIAVIQASLEGLGNTPNPYLAEIELATARLQRVVDGLLQMTRLESEIVKPNLDWCDLHEVVAAAKSMVGESLSSHPVSERIPDGLPFVKVDQVLVVQALANILHNAATYSPPSATIEIAISMEQKCLRIVVRDHGNGLQQGDEKRIFRKFYRAKGAKPGGTGLGLSIAQGFIEVQGGKILARNHPDGGAEFVIEIECEAQGARHQ